MRGPQGVPTRDGRPGVGVSLPPVRRRFFRRMPWILVLAWVVCAGATAAVCVQELKLSGAISVKEAVEELGRRFVQDRSAARLHFNFGGSGELQKQIEAGARAQGDFDLEIDVPRFVSEMLRIEQERAW
jgi:hypothetical protein